MTADLGTDSVDISKRILLAFGLCLTQCSLSKAEVCAHLNFVVCFPLEEFPFELCSFSTKGIPLVEHRKGDKRITVQQFFALQNRNNMCSVQGPCLDYHPGNQRRGGLDRRILTNSMSTQICGSLSRQHSKMQSLGLSGSWPSRVNVTISSERISHRHPIFSASLAYFRDEAAHKQISEFS